MCPDREPVPNQSRRDFVGKAIYVPPAILTLAAAPAYVKAGSVKPESGGWDDYKDKSDDKDKDKSKDKSKDKG